MKNDKKSLGIFVDWYEPGYKAGGLIRSVSGLVSNLSPYFNIYIITRDRDLNAREAYESVTVNEWTEIQENVYVLYLSPSKIFKNIRKHTKNLKFDWIYCNSFFSFKFSILPAILFRFKLIDAGNLLIAPRGELKPAALKIKPIKKRFFLSLINNLKFYRKANWHATSEEDLDYISSAIKASDIFLAPNLSKIIQNKIIYQKKRTGQLKVVFISRIISYKNLKYALNLLRDMEKIKGVSLDIYGPIEDREYFESCMKIAGQSALNIQYKGELEHYRVEETFSVYHLFLFPTTGENFGHVIAESLKAGCPVLTTDLTPWNDLEANDAGWSFGLNHSESFKRVIQHMYEMKQEDFDLKRKSVLNYAEERINNSKTIKKYIDFFSA